MAGSHKVSYKHLKGGFDSRTADQGSLAQWLVHPAHNRTVFGSSPKGPTKRKVRGGILT
jgi:hypothetical protein